MDPRMSVQRAATAGPSQGLSKLHEEVDDHTHWHRERHDSSFAQQGQEPGPIAMEDHTFDRGDESSALWAKRITIDEYVIVGGSLVGGSYVVWHCTVDTLDGAPITIRKRYSEFDTLRQRLIKTFPNSQAAMPPLPRKSIVSRFNPKFLEKRKAGLVYFLNCVLLNPEFAGSPVLKEFLFS